MLTHPSGAGATRQHRLLTFARSNDAQLYALGTHLTSAEAARLRATLDRLVEIGALALFRIDTPISSAGTWETVAAYLREQVGAMVADAAARAANHAATPTPRPQTLIPVWPFERLPGCPDVLTACGLFMGAPIMFEALPVLDVDLAEPTPEVAARFDAWRVPFDNETALGTIALPGSDKMHVVFAAVKPG